jgi:N-acetylglucosaminyl-diphospho-decaprenol L-rhamnosyltransferase
MKVVLSVVSHGQAELVDELLKSIDTYVECSHEIYIYILHNITQDYEYQEIKFPRLIVNALNKNGFGTNHNKVFEFTNPDFIFIINPDILFVEPVNLDLLLEKVPELGIASPHIVNQKMKTVDFRRSDLTIYNLLRRHIFRRPEQDFDWLAGMFLILNKKTFSFLNGFDEKFFMYVEDCDLSKRCKSGGGDLVILSSKVVHNEQRASRKSLQHLIWHVSSLVRYVFLK